MNLIEIFKRYRKSYANYLSVLYNMKRNKSNIKVKLRDGQMHDWNVEKTYWYALIKANPNLDVNLDLLPSSRDKPLNFEFKGRPLTLVTGIYGNGKREGDFSAVYVSEDYKFLNVEDKNVIDIGANIGASSLYFALRNAKKVVALEPYPYSYSIAIKNLQLNSIGKERVTLLNAGYGEDGTIKINSDFESTVGSDLKSSKEGVEIRIISLKTLLEENNFDTAVLKMDCEGCEYNIVNEQDEALRKFKQIQIEYHYGYEKLKSKLEEVGFTVRYTKPTKSYNKNATNPNMSVGFIYAER